MSRYLKAKKEVVKGRFILAGTAGAGRIRAALNLAFGLTDGRVAVLDTDGMVKLHADAGDFDVLEMSAPYTTDRFITAVEIAEKEGYSVLIIDTLSQAWGGEGGILEQVGKLKASKGNSNGAWDQVQPLHDEMMSRIKRSNLHVLVILQCKTEYFVCDQPGALAPKKVGLAPIQRDGIDYGFHAVFYVDEPSQVATCSADHTGLFGSSFAEVMNKEHGAKLRAWLESGVKASVVAKQENPAEKRPESSDPTPMFINKNQVDNVRSLLMETSSDARAFLAYFKAEKLETLPASKYADAVSMLEAKKAQTNQGTPKAANKNLAETLKARNIPFEETTEGLLAKPSFSDSAAKDFLRESGFKWAAKKKAWLLAA